MKKAIYLLVLICSLFYGTSSNAQTITGVSSSTMCDSLSGMISISSYTAGLRVKTIYGDGSTTIDTVYTFSGYISAYPSHRYTTPGAYTVKSILYSGATPIDSIVYFLTATSGCGFSELVAYEDVNGNCRKDSLEPEIGLPMRIQIDSAGVPIDTINFSGANYTLGYYGVVYTYRLLTPPQSFRVTCPTTGVVHDTIGYMGHKKYLGFICDTTGFDLTVSGNTQATRIRAVASFNIQNNRCTPQSATVTFSFSPKYRLDTIYFYPHTAYPYTVSGNTVAMNIGILTINQVKQIHAILYPTSTLTMGDTAHFSISVAPTTGDARPSNNVINEVDTIRGSYDPNAKSVTPEGNISAGTQLQYMIEFENTGNDTAFNIHVMDTLSDFLDVSTLQPVSSSARVNYILSKWNGHNVLKLDYPNINLLDSSYHGLCHGNSIFKVNVKSDAPLGTLVKNRVGIYFDYNPVIMTNEVSNSIPYPTSVLGANAGESVVVYPNPVHDILHFGNTMGGNTIYTVTDITGRTLLIGMSTQNNVDVSGLLNGMYIISLQQEGKASVVSKFIKD